MSWARFSQNGYECSSHGDQRFSALFARLKDGRTIEEAYQLDVKGFREITGNWREAKGQPARNGKTHSELWADYLKLWELFALENPELIEELEKISRGLVLTDKFASTSISQARALSVILTNIRVNTKLPFTF